MKTSSDGIAVLKFYEECRLRAYPDPATGGVPFTIGWGYCGPEVRPGLVWTQEQADRALADRLMDEFEPGVDKLVTAPVKPCQYAGLISLAYNIGLGAFKSSTLLKMINLGNTAGAADQFLRWDKANKKSMLGLRRRRCSERALFLGASGERAIEIGQAAL